MGILKERLSNLFIKKIITAEQLDKAVTKGWITELERDDILADWKEKNEESGI